MRKWIIAISIVILLYLQISGLTIREDIGGKVFGQIYPSQQGQVEIGYQGVIRKRWWHREWVRIVPDDCVKMIIVNDVQLDLGYLREEQLCNWGVGFDYPLGRYLDDGENRVIVSISDIGGSYQLDITQTPRVRNIQLLILLLVTTLIVIETKSLPLFEKLSKLERGILVLAIVLRIAYLLATPHTVNTHDVDLHKEYIQWVANNWWIPSVTDCVICHKPPLYYLLTGWLWAVISKFEGNWDILQWWQLLLNLGFIYYTIKIVDSNVEDGAYKGCSQVATTAPCSQVATTASPKYKRLMVLLPMLFLPSAIIHSSRISSDLQYYFLIAGTYYHYFQWTKTSLDRHLAWGLWMLLLAFLTTLTAIAYIPMWIIMFVYKSAYREYEVEKYKLSITGAATGIIAFLGYKLWQLNFHGYDLINGNIDALVEGIKVEVTGIGRYIGIHRGFMDYGINPWDKGESQYFINYALKSLVHGEFKMITDVGVLANIGSLMQLVALIMMGIILVYMLKMKGKQWLFNMDLLLAISFPVMALIYYSFSFAYTPTSDFRYVYATLIPMLLLYVRAIMGLKRGLLAIVVRLFPMFMGIGGIMITLTRIVSR